MDRRWRVGAHTRDRWRVGAASAPYLHCWHWRRDGNPDSDRQSVYIVGIPALFMSTEGAGADFPCSPTRNMRTVPTPLGTIQTITYVAEVDGKHYEIMVADYGTVFSGGLTGILRSIVLDRTKASTMDEYLMKERSSEASTLNNASGQLVNADNATRALRLKLYAVGKKLYRIGISTPLDQIDDPQNNTFLDSFIIPAE